MDTCVGFVTYGGVEFTKLLVESVKRTTDKVDMFAVVGKVDDHDTINYLTKEGIPFIIHHTNMGFPVGVNDIYDYVWKENQYKYLILAGNDIITYDYAINSLIKQADETDYEVISAYQYDVRELVKDFPEVKETFLGRDCIIRDFSTEPWNKFKGGSPVLELADMQMFDIQNLCLYKKSVFDRVGYLDANFYPAYFVDNDYARRIVLSGIKNCTLLNARFFHFWSRVLKQGSGGSAPHFFENNRRYYINKWGGGLGQETKTPELSIFDRSYEFDAVTYWKTH